MAELYRVRVGWTGGSGTPWLSTHYFLESAGTAQQAATAVGVFWGAVDALINSGHDWATEPDVSTIESTTGALTGVVQTTSQTGTGGSAVERLPQATQGLLQLRTGAVIGDRELRGRIFIPGLTQDSNDAGDVIAATITAVNAAAVTLMTSANADLHIWKRPSSSGGSDGSNAQVVGASMWTKFAVMRSRRD